MINFIKYTFIQLEQILGRTDEVLKILFVAEIIQYNFRKIIY